MVKLYASRMESIYEVHNNFSGYRVTRWMLLVQ